MAGEVSSLAPQAALKISRSQVIEPVQPRTFLGLGVFSCLRHGDASLSSETPDCLRERDALNPGEKGKNVAAYPATEAVEKSPLLVDTEGWGTLAVKWAEPGVTAPGFAQRDVGRDHLDNADTSADFRQRLFWNPFRHG